MIPKRAGLRYQTLPHPSALCRRVRKRCPQDKKGVALGHLTRRHTGAGGVNCEPTLVGIVATPRGCRNCAQSDPLGSPIFIKVLWWPLGCRNCTPHGVQQEPSTAQYSCSDRRDCAPSVRNFGPSVACNVAAHLHASVVCKEGPSWARGFINYGLLLRRKQQRA